MHYITKGSLLPGGCTFDVKSQQVFIPPKTLQKILHSEKCPIFLKLQSQILAFNMNVGYQGERKGKHPTEEMHPHSMLLPSSWLSDDDIFSDMCADFKSTYQIIFFHIFFNLFITYIMVHAGETCMYFLPPFSKP